MEKTDDVFCNEYQLRCPKCDIRIIRKDESWKHAQKYFESMGKHKPQTKEPKMAHHKPGELVPEIDEFRAEKVLVRLCGHWFLGYADTNNRRHLLCMGHCVLDASMDFDYVFLPGRKVGEK